MTGKIVNIAGYRFVDLPDRDALKNPLESVCLDLGLKGTILLSNEGINFFVAGLQANVDAFIAYLERDERFRIYHSKYPTQHTNPSTA